MVLPKGHFWRFNTTTVNGKFKNAAIQSDNAKLVNNKLIPDLIAARRYTMPQINKLPLKEIHITTSNIIVRNTRTPTDGYIDEYKVVALTVVATVDIFIEVIICDVDTAKGPAIETSHLLYFNTFLLMNQSKVKLIA